MKTLSIFVDESGTINVKAKHIPYYIISIVLHNQNDDISSDIIKLNYELSKYGLNSNLVHTEPLIRNEDIYNGMLQMIEEASFLSSISLSNIQI